MLFATVLMLSACGITDVTSQTIGYGSRVEIGTVAENNGDLYVRLTNNAVSIQTHDGEEIRVEYSPPTRGRYVVPNMQFDTQTNRIEITESSNIHRRRDYRSGIVYIYLPQDIGTDRNMIFNSAAGVVRIIGNDGRMAASINVSNMAGVTELRNFSADDISVSSMAGAINANELSIDNIELRTTSGVIALRNSAISGNLTARTIVGVVTLNNVDTDMSRADVSLLTGVSR